jgi:hypothetical protein
MSSYLWISGAIQPDTTQRRGRSRKYMLLFVTVGLVIALTAAIVRARAMTNSVATQTVVQIGH